MTRTKSLFGIYSSGLGELLSLQRTMTEAMHRTSQFASLQRTMTEAMRPAIQSASLQRTMTEAMRPAIQSASLQRTMTEAMHRTSQFASLQRTMTEAMHRTSQFASLQRTMTEAMRPTIQSASLQRTMTEAMRPAIQSASLQRAITEAIRPAIQFGSLQRAMTEAMRPAIQFGSLQRAMTEAMRPAIQFASLQRAMTEAIRPVSQFGSLFSYKIFDSLALFREGAKLERTGWFPHSTFPTHLLTQGYDDTYLDEAVLTYYRVNWAKVRQTIEEELSQCHVDDDAKEALRQALVAHEEGLYRLVPPSLFPVIERAVRVCLHADRIGNFSVKKQLETCLRDLPLSVLPYGALGFFGYSQLSHHLYEGIHTDSARQRFLVAPVPNRHAAIHGLVVYSSAKSSLNTIFVAMYVFRVLTVSS